MSLFVKVKVHVTGEKHFSQRDRGTENLIRARFVALSYLSILYPYMSSCGHRQNLDLLETGKIKLKCLLAKLAFFFSCTFDHFEKLKRQNRQKNSTC